MSDLSMLEWVFLTAGISTGLYGTSPIWMKLARWMMGNPSEISETTLSEFGQAHQEIADWRDVLYTGSREPSVSELLAWEKASTSLVQVCERFSIPHHEPLRVEMEQQERFPPYHEPPDEYSMNFDSLQEWRNFSSRLAGYAKADDLKSARRSV